MIDWDPEVYGPAPRVDCCALPLAITEKSRESPAVNLLFICSQNKLRSPTAEAVFAETPGIDVDSAGLNNDAIVPLTPEQVEWADVIFVMEKTHRNKLNRKFKRHLNGQRVIVLGIPDNYDYMDPALVSLLKLKVTPLL